MRWKHGASPAAGKKANRRRPQGKAPPVPDIPLTIICKKLYSGMVEPWFRLQALKALIEGSADCKQVFKECDRFKNVDKVRRFLVSIWDEYADFAKLRTAAPKALSSESLRARYREWADLGATKLKPAEMLNATQHKDDKNRAGTADERIAWVSEHLSRNLGLYAVVIQSELNADGCAGAIVSSQNSSCNRLEGAKNSLSRNLIVTFVSMCFPRLTLPFFPQAGQLSEYQDHLKKTTMCVQDWTGDVAEYNSSADFHVLNYLSGSDMAQVPIKDWRAILLSHDYGLGLYEGDDRPANLNEMQTAYTLFLGRLRCESYCVLIVFCAPEMIGDCVKAMVDSRFANCEGANQTRVIVWHKPNKYSKNNNCMAFTTEFAVMGVHTPDGKYPANLFKRWFDQDPGEDRNMQPKHPVIQVPCNRNWTVHPNTGQTINRTEENPFLAYEVTPSTSLYIQPLIDMCVYTNAHIT